MEEGRLIVLTLSRRRFSRRAAALGLLGLASAAAASLPPEAAAARTSPPSGRDATSALVHRIDPEDPPGPAIVQVLVDTNAVLTTPRHDSPVATAFSAVGPGPAPPPTASRKKTNRSGPGSSAKSRDLLETARLPQIRKAIEDRRGAPLLLNFWAVWCEPCVDELPDLATVETRFASSRIRVLGVSGDLLLEDDSPSLRKKVREVLVAAKVTYPNLLYDGPSDLLVESFALPGPIPHSILYAPDGTELQRWTGRLTLEDLAEALSPRPKTP